MTTGRPLPDPVPPIKPHTREYYCVCGKPLVYRADPVYGRVGWWCPDGYNCKGKGKA